MAAFVDFCLASLLVVAGAALAVASVLIAGALVGCFLGAVAASAAFVFRLCV